MVTMSKSVLCAGAVAIFAVASTSTASIIGPFTTGGSGTFSLAGPTITIDADVTNQTPDYDFDSLDASLTLDTLDPNTTFSGSFVLSGSQGDLFATMNGNIFGVNSPFATAAGDFIITGGTGIFDGAIGDGVFNAFTDNNAGTVQFKIAGVIIPAPAGMAVLAGFGLLGGRRRRS